MGFDHARIDAQCGLAIGAVPPPLCALEAIKHDRGWSL